MNFETIELGAGSYPDAPEETETENEEEKEYLEYEGYMDQCLEEELK